MKFSPAEDVWYCNSPLGKHKLENLLSEMSKKHDWLLSTPHIVCEPLLWQSWRHLGLKMLEWSRWQAIRLTQLTDSVENYHKRPTLEQQIESSAIVSNFVAGPTQCQVGRERALMEIQQKPHLKESGCQVQVASASHVNMEHSVNPSGQSFSDGQFHNCIFNIKYCSNWTRDERTRATKCRLFRSRRWLHFFKKRRINSLWSCSRKKDWGCKSYPPLVSTQLKKYVFLSR